MGCSLCIYLKKAQTLHKISSNDYTVSIKKAGQNQYIHAIDFGETIVSLILSLFPPLLHFSHGNMSGVFI